MARTIDSAKRVINGTWGEAWVDGEKVAECSAAQAKVGKNKTTINLCGQFMEDTKAASGKGTGSQRESGIQDGIDVRCTVILKLSDPDSWGAERVALYNVSFDDMTLADWKAATVGSVTAPFTFSRYELLDLIEAE